MELQATHIRECLDFLKEKLALWGYKGDKKADFTVAKFLNRFGMEIMSERGGDYEVAIDMPYKYKEFLLSCEYLLNGEFTVVKEFSLTDEEREDFKSRICEFFYNFMFFGGGVDLFGELEQAELENKMSNASVADEDREERNENQPAENAGMQADQKDEDEDVLEHVDEDIQVLRMIRHVAHHRLQHNHRTPPRMPPPHGTEFMPFWYMMAWRIANNPIRDEVVYDNRYREEVEKEKRMRRYQREQLEMFNRIREQQAQEEELNNAAANEAPAEEPALGNAPEEEEAAAVEVLQDQAANVMVGGESTSDEYEEGFVSDQQRNEDTSNDEAE